MTEILRWAYNQWAFKTARMRAIAYSFLCNSVGTDVDIMSGVRILCPSGVKIGNHTGINVNVTLDGNGDLSIGDFVMIGPNCLILTSGHGFNSRAMPMKCQGIRKGQVIIEDDVWLGANVVVMPGVTLGRGSIISAGAIVTRDIHPFHIAGGNPAKSVAIRPKD